MPNNISPTKQQAVTGSNTVFPQPAAGWSSGTQIYQMPAAISLVPSPLFFGLPGDSNEPNAIRQAKIHPFQPCAFDSDAFGCKPNYKSTFYEPAYAKQVGENYGEVGAIDSRSIAYMGPWQDLHWVMLGNGPLNEQQFNLLQPTPYWNVWAISPQQLASYEQVNGMYVTQVPTEYGPAGPPNIYLGK